MTTAPSFTRTPIFRRDRESIVDQQCRVCGTVTKEFHFGAVCCVACGAFFRRAVSEKRVFVCKKGGKCEIDGRYDYLRLDGRAACRSCRIEKCIAIGMDPNCKGAHHAVQPPRTANGKIVSDSDSGHESNQSSSSDFPLPRLFTPDPHPPEFSSVETDVTSEVLHLFETKAAICSTPSETNTINNFMASYIHLLETRKLIYSNGTIEEMIRGDPPRPKKAPWFYRLRREALRTEGALVAQMLRICPTYNGYTLDEKTVLFKNYIVVISVLEKYFITMKNGGIENKCMYHIDGTYTDMDDPNMEYPEEALRMLDADTLHKLFVEPHMNNLRTLSIPMREMGMTEIDLIGLLTWCLFDPDLPELPLDSRFKVDQARAIVHNCWINFYELHNIPNGQLRIARCLSLLPVVNAIAERQKENFHLFRVFGLFEYDEVLAYVFDFQKPKTEAMDDQANGVIVPNLRNGRNEDGPLYQLTFL